MSRVFADSFYFFAILNLRDRAHPVALEFAKRHDGSLVTMG